MKRIKLLSAFWIIGFICLSVHLQGQDVGRHAPGADTVDTQNSKVDVKNETIKSNAANVSTGIFFVSVQNHTPWDVYIYVDKQFAFGLKSKNNQIKGSNVVKKYALNGPHKMYARSINNKLQWGPIELDASMNGFTWKLSR